MRTIKNVINLFFLLLGHLFPRSKRKIVFGAWNGNSYSDNPKFLFQYFFSHPEWQIVWIGNKQVRATLPTLPSHASFAVRHSLKGMWHALTAGTWVFSHCPNDISILAAWGKALQLNLWHGVALKKVGVMCHSFKSQPNILDPILKRLSRKKIYLGIPGKIQYDLLTTGYPNMFKEKLLPFGSPTLDYIINNKTNSKLIADLRKKFGSLFDLPIEKKWIVYAPTFRWTTIQSFSFVKLPPSNRRRIQLLLEKNMSIIIEKLHPNSIPNQNTKCTNNFFSLQGAAAKKIDPFELWLAADAIISDYSGSTIPFYLQGKPVIHFAYDYDFYTKRDTGLIADLNAIRFGLTTKSIDELCDAIDHLQSAVNQCGKLAPSLIEYEDGHSCEKYGKFIYEMTSAKKV